MPNRLINESSPYLQQHAHNPVDWFPWGKEALEKARAEDKPILLSVGYSACHWCHVMERESFEDEETARIMNEHFVCIKVDREERPDIDSIYMAAVQGMTGQGGWPMTVFLTPDGKPIYGGTYFPPVDSHGLPAFRKVLMTIAHAYSSRKSELAASAANITQQLSQMKSVNTSDASPLSEDILHQSFTAISQQFDELHGGFSGAPKFPQPMISEFLLLYHYRTKNDDALRMVELTLENMAYGGMFDHLGGGFHRYSTDDHWLVPHFEKMLYDNALLARLYLHAFQITGRPLYKHIVKETLDYILRDMTDENGGFYSSQDADSESIEGKYYVWHPQEIADVLGEHDANIFCRYYGATDSGNFDGSNILHVATSEHDLAQESEISVDNLDHLLSNARARLLASRQKRVPPACDRKILTAWNGLALHSLAEAALLLQEPVYLKAAKKNASFLLTNLRVNGRILRTFGNGHAKLNGYLEDYAFLIEGLLALHEATLESRWLKEAVDLSKSTVDLFWDDGDKTFYDTGSDHEALIIRPRDIFDTAVPSGSSAATDILLRMAIITDDNSYRQKALAMLKSAKALIMQVPAGLPNWLCASDFHLSSLKEIVIVGQPDNPATLSLLEAASSSYNPNKILVGMLSDTSGGIFDSPLFQNRSTVNGLPTAYVCQNYTCQLPATSPEHLFAQLSS